MTKPQGPPTDDAAKLPHDRDESPADPDTAPSTAAQHDANRAPIRQAHADAESDKQDTERIGTPNDVPTKDSAAV